MEKHNTQIDQNNLENRISRINTTQLGMITAVSDDSKTCTVLLANKRNFQGKVEDQAELLEVPIFYPSVGGFVITLPIKDYLPCPCMILFAQRSLDKWIGGEGENSHTEDSRMHDISDGMAFVGMSAKSIDNINSKNFEVRSWDGKSKFEFSEDGKFRFTNGSEELLQILSDTLSALSKTKAQVGWGSSKGVHPIDTIPDFIKLKSRLKELKF